MIIVLLRHRRQLRIAMTFFEQIDCPPLPLTGAARPPRGSSIICMPLQQRYAEIRPGTQTAKVAR